MKVLLLGLVVGVALFAAPASQTFTGTITDSECANANHAAMQMGPTDSDCVVACVDVHGATYVLYDGKMAYPLSDQAAPEKFAAKKVTITGTMDAVTHKIQVESITAAK